MKKNRRKDRKMIGLRIITKIKLDGNICCTIRESNRTTNFLLSSATSCSRCINLLVFSHVETTYSTFYFYIYAHVNQVRKFCNNPKTNEKKYHQEIAHLRFFFTNNASHNLQAFNRSAYLLIRSNSLLPSFVLKSF